jgi:bifunctional DNA-binding transcriptional regulator/antitoxin component of YhaV-PrlF toxin-antitoxin module
MEAVIRKGRIIIELPEELMGKFGLRIGDKIILKENEKGLSILPKRSIVDEIRGSIKVDDEEAIDEIISAEVWDLN